MHLAEWFESHPGMTLAAFGQMVGARHSTVSRWRAGKLRPAWPQLLRIMAATGGQVTPNDFITAAELEAAQAAIVVDPRQHALPFVQDQAAA